MIRCLVITHGRLGDELLYNVEAILGPIEGMQSMTNQGQSARDLVSAVSDWLAAALADKQDAAVLFVDDYGGSCATAAQLAATGRMQIVILSGVNLAMLLGFVTWRPSLDLAELAQKLVEKGREAITRIGAKRGD
jgi:mannose/fructose-specific phosphotransferase system component IIA